MAEKEKKNFLSLVAREYKYEGLILFVLSIIVMVLGTLIIVGANSNGQSGIVVNKNFYFIGENPKVFAWVLIVLGAASFILAVWPYVKPSIGEVKRVSWPSKKTMLTNVLIVFGFIIVIAVLFIGYDALLNQVVKLFKWLAGLLK